MKKVYLGSFETKGKLLAGDPCYDSGELVSLKVKPGKYHCYVIQGQLSKPLFIGDKNPDNFRIARLEIIHDDYQNQNILFESKKSRLSVDSGQVGFFKEEAFSQDLDSPVDMVTDPVDAMREEIKDLRTEIIKFEDALNTKNALFTRMVDLFKTEEETYAYFEKEVSNRMSLIEENEEMIRSGNIPEHYGGTDQAYEFYDIICDLTLGYKKAGVFSHYGVASSSGIGDGSYPLFVSKDNGQIIACCAGFLKVKEII